MLDIIDILIRPAFARNFHVGAHRRIIKNSSVRPRRNTALFGCAEHIDTSPSTYRLAAARGAVISPFSIESRMTEKLQSFGVERPNE